MNHMTHSLQPKGAPTMDTPIHDLTPDMYHERVISETMREYACSREDAEEQHPRAETDHDHYRACYDFVRFGGDLSERVLDALTTMQCAAILHDWPNRNQDYIPPSVRELNEHEEAFTALCSVARAYWDMWYQHYSHGGADALLAHLLELLAEHGYIAVQGRSDGPITSVHHITPSSDVIFEAVRLVTGWSEEGAAP